MKKEVFFKNKYFPQVKRFKFEILSINSLKHGQKFPYTRNMWDRWEGIFPRRGKTRKTGIGNFFQLHYFKKQISFSNSACFFTHLIIKFVN